MNPVKLHAEQVRRDACFGITVLLLAASLFSGCRSASPAAGNPTPALSSRARQQSPPFDPEMIRPGQQLVVMFDFPGSDVPLELEKRVKEDGTITLLSNQVFSVTNKILAQVETEIQDFYVPKYFKQLHVRTMFGCCPQFYSVAGAVRSPGRQVYDDPVSLFDAINAAGGMTRKADPTRVSITHTDVAIATIDLTRPESEEGRKFQVQPGMRILVPSSPWWWLK